MIRQHLKWLFRWLPAIAVLLISALGLMMIRRGFSARDKPTWMEAFAASSMRSLAIPANAKRMSNPVPNTAENLTEARAHWADHCAICHGNDGKGNTTIGQNLYPKAPDMNLPATQNMTDGELYYTIQNGIRLTGMPAWGQAVDHDSDTWKLVHFIRHLPQLTPEDEQEMERLNPKGPEARQEEQEEEQFLNEEQRGSQAPKPPTHHNH